MAEALGRMDGKLCMVTGATAGIGYITARELAKLGAHVIAVGRNPRKTDDAVGKLRQESGSQAIEPMLADLSSLKQVRDLASQFRSRHQKLDVLLNNAGALNLSRELSPDGIEMTFAVNHLSYFALTLLLLEPLRAAGRSRIVNVSSGAHFSGKMKFDDLQGQRRYGGWPAYAQSKLCNVLFTYELARRLKGSEVTANVLHPGFVATSFAANNGWVVRTLKPVWDLFAITPDKGAETNVYLAASPEVEGVSGQYFYKKRAVRSSRASHDEEAQRKLWQISEQMTGISWPAGA